VLREVYQQSAATALLAVKASPSRNSSSSNIKLNSVIKLFNFYQNLVLPNIVLIT
jgi:hypothetical protein